MTKFNYSLQASVVHIGMDATSGHYVAYILNDDKWYLFDDTNVTEVCEAEVLRQQSYILFYQRNNLLKEVSWSLGDVVNLIALC